MLINAPIARQFFASLAIPSVPSVLYPFVFCGLLEIVWNSTRARWHIWFLKWWSKSLQCSSPEQFSDTSLLVRQIFCVGCMQFMPSATQVASYSNRWPATATRRWALEESSETQAPRSGQNRTSTNNFISTYLCFLCLPADRTARRSILVLPRGFAPGTWLIIIDEQWQSLKINHFLFAWQGHLLEGWPRLHTKGEAAWRTGRTRTMSGTPLSYNPWHWNWPCWSTTCLAGLSCLCKLQQSIWIGKDMKGHRSIASLWPTCPQDAKLGDEPSPRTAVMTCQLLLLLLQ